MTRETNTRRTQAERRAHAETQLLSAAIALLATRGYDGFTLAQVGEAAGFSRGLPAHYFGRKDAMLAKAVEVAVDRYVASLNRLPDAAPGMARIAALVRHHAQIGDTQGSRALNILLAEASLRPELHAVIARLTEQGLQRLRRELEDGKADAAIAPAVEVEPVARMIFAFLRGQMSFSIIDHQHDAKAAAEAFITILERALSPEKA